MKIYRKINQNFNKKEKKLLFFCNDKYNILQFKTFDISAEIFNYGKKLIQEDEFFQANSHKNISNI